VRLRVSRVVTVIDAGRILNPLAGRNQIEGRGGVMGIGMALFRAHLVRSADGRANQQQPGRTTSCPSTPDVPPLDVHFVENPDKEV